MDVQQMNATATRSCQLCGQNYNQIAEYKNTPIQKKSKHPTTKLKGNHKYFHNQSMVMINNIYVKM